MLLALVVAVSCRGSSEPLFTIRHCEIFPHPPPSLSARATSLPTQEAWHQDISKAPRAANSARIIDYIDSHGEDHVHPDFGSRYADGFPYKVVGRHQKPLSIHYTGYGAESSRGPFPVPGDAPVEGGRRAPGDRHVIVIDKATCTLYELYRAFFVSGPSPHWNATSGVAWKLDSAALRPNGWTSADAAGLPIFPGLIGYEETAQGRLNHAIRVTMASTRSAFVHPATHCAGDTTNPAAPPMGLRLRLKASYSLAGLRGTARTIAVTMKHYGLIVADNGANWSISGASDRRWSEANLEQLKRIPGSAFEVVRSAAAVRRC